MGFWFQFSNNKTEVAKDSPRIVLPPIAETVAKEIPVEKPLDLVVEKPRKSVERKITNVKKIIPQIILQNKPATRNVEAKKPDDSIAAQNIEAKKTKIELTKEEKYAYKQLMLALSITSSKLKLVADKIDNIEQSKVVDKNER